MVGELLAGLFLIGLGTVLFRYSRLISNWLWNFDNQIRKDVAGTFLEKTIYNENYWLSWGTIARKGGSRILDMGNPVDGCRLYCWRGSNHICWRRPLIEITGRYKLTRVNSGTPY